MEGSINLNNVTLSFGSYDQTLNSVKEIADACKDGNFDFKRKRGFMDFDLIDKLTKYIKPTSLVKPQRNFFGYEDYKKLMKEHLATLQIYSELENLAHEYGECLLKLGFSKINLAFLRCDASVVDQEKESLENMGIYEAGRNLRFFWFAREYCGDMFKNMNFCYQNYPIQTIIQENSKNLFIILSGQGDTAWSIGHLESIHRSVEQSGNWDFFLAGDGRFDIDMDNISDIDDCSITENNAKLYDQIVLHYNFHGSEKLNKKFVENFMKILDDTHTALSEKTLVFDTCKSGIVLTNHTSANVLLNQFSHVYTSSQSSKYSITKYEFTTKVDSFYTYPELLDTFFQAWSNNNNPIIAGKITKPSQNTYDKYELNKLGCKDECGFYVDQSDVLKYVINIKEFYNSFCHFGSYADCITSFEKDHSKFAAYHQYKEEDYMVCLPVEDLDIENIKEENLDIENSYFVFGAI